MTSKKLRKDISEQDLAILLKQMSNTLETSEVDINNVRGTWTFDATMNIECGEPRLSIEVYKRPSGIIYSEYLSNRKIRLRGFDVEDYIRNILSEYNAQARKPEPTMTDHLVDFIKSFF